MACPNVRKNLERCTCTYEPCGRKGDCCACLHYHRSMNQLPACFFTKEEEATYDRSVAYFVRCRSKR